MHILPSAYFLPDGLITAGPDVNVRKQIGALECPRAIRKIFEEQPHAQ